MEQGESLGPLFQVRMSLNGLFLGKKWINAAA